MKSEILAAYFAQLALYKLGGPWSRLPPCEDARIVDTDGEQVLHKLVKRFSAKALVASGIAIPAGKKTALNPKISGHGTPVLALRDTEHGEIFELLTPTGLVCSGNPSAVEIWRDRSTQASMSAWEGNDPLLLIAFDFADLVALRSISLPVAMSDGLDAVDATSIPLLRKYLQISKDQRVPYAATRQNGAAPIPPNLANGEKNRPIVHESEPSQLPQLMLVRWRPAQLRTETRPSYDRFTADKNEARISLAHVLDWQATAKRCARLRKALQAGDKGEALDLMVASTEDEAHEWPTSPAPQQQLQPEPEPNISSFADAIQRFLDAASSQQSNARQATKKASDDYRRLVERQILQPLLLRADVAHEVTEKIRNLILAQWVAALQASALATYAAQAQPNSQGARLITHHKLIQTMVLLGKEIVTLCKESKKCRAPTAKATSDRDSNRFANCNSRSKN